MLSFVVVSIMSLRLIVVLSFVSQVPPQTTPRRSRKAESAAPVTDLPDFAPTSSSSPKPSPKPPAKGVQSKIQSLIAAAEDGGHDADEGTAAKTRPRSDIFLSFSLRFGLVVYCCLVVLLLMFAAMDEWCSWPVQVMLC